MTDAADVLMQDARIFESLAQRASILKPRHLLAGRFAGQFLQTREGRTIQDFTSLDYLAFGSWAPLKELMREAIASTDLGCPASQTILMTEEQALLEETIARFHYGEGGGTLLCTSGYAANFNVMEVLGLRSGAGLLRFYQDELATLGARRRPTVFFFDSELHLSAQHGIRFATKLQPDVCKKVSYRSGDYDLLENELRSARQELEDALFIIATDSLSSTTGRQYDMERLLAISESYNALLYVAKLTRWDAWGRKGRALQRRPGASTFTRTDLSPWGLLPRPSRCSGAT